MRTISLSAIFNKGQVQKRTAESRADEIRLPVIVELTPEQRAYVSGGPQVKNDPQR